MRGLIDFVCVVLLWLHHMSLPYSNRRKTPGVLLHSACINVVHHLHCCMIAR